MLALVADDGVHTVRDTLTVEVTGTPTTGPGDDVTAPAFSDTRISVVVQVDGDLASVTLDGVAASPSEDGRLTVDFDLATGARSVVVEVVGKDGSKIRRTLTVEPEEVSL